MLFGRSSRPIETPQAPTSSRHARTRWIARCATRAAPRRRSATCLRRARPAPTASPASLGGTPTPRTLRARPARALREHCRTHRRDAAVRVRRRAAGRASRHGPPQGCSRPAASAQTLRERACPSPLRRAPRSRPAPWRRCATRSGASRACRAAGRRAGRSPSRRGRSRRGSPFARRPRTASRRRRGRAAARCRATAPRDR
jgi:hypothetical protein